MTNYFVGIGLVTDLVTDIRHDTTKPPVIPSSIPSCKDNKENPSQSVNPSLFNKVKTPTRLEDSDEKCSVCGHDNIGFWDDGAIGYRFCLDCNPNFNEGAN